MADELLQLVTTHLLSRIERLGFEVEKSQTFDIFDNARVVLRGPSVRMLVVRERGQILVAFGPPSEPATWFDSDTVVEYLGLSVDHSFSLTNASDALRGAGAFAGACNAELSRMFDDQHLEGTKRELKALKERRAERLFGWKPPSSGGV
jgi:hypothetical protein